MSQVSRYAPQFVRDGPRTFVIICWKRLYSKLYAVEYGDDGNFEIELQKYQLHFMAGLFQFGCHLRTQSTPLFRNTSTTFEDILYNKLSTLLGLNIDDTKEVFSNYLMYTCNIANELLQEQLEKNMKPILIGVYTFYTEEQVYFLKCLTLILMKSKEKHDTVRFNEFLTKERLRELYTNIVNQFFYVTELELPGQFENLTNKLTPVWIDCCLRIQMELLHLLILLASCDIELTMEDRSNYITMLQKTDYGQQQSFLYSNQKKEVHARMQQEIRYGLVMLGIQLFQSGWSEDIYGDNPLFKEHDTVLFPKAYTEVNCPIMLPWLLLKCNRQEVAPLLPPYSLRVDVDQWKGIADMLKSPIMELAKAEQKIKQMIENLVFTWLTYFCPWEMELKDSFVSLICYVNKFKCYPVLHDAVDEVLSYYCKRFPYDCKNLFKIMASILEEADKNQTELIFKLFSKLNYAYPLKLAKYRIDGNRFVLTEDIRPLKHFKKRIVPSGRVVIPMHEDNILLLPGINIPAWDILREILSLFLQNEEFYGGPLIPTVKETMDFALKLIQKINVSSDMCQFSELVLEITWKLGRLKNNQWTEEKLEVLALCIKYCSIWLCVMTNDVLSCFEIHQLFPNYSRHVKPNEVFHSSNGYVNSALFSIVSRVEVTYKRYNVLEAYLDFLQMLVKKEVYSWYTVAGLEFLFHMYRCVNRGIFKFSDYGQRTTIIWKFTEILNDVFAAGLMHMHKKDGFTGEEVIYVGSAYKPTLHFITKITTVCILKEFNYNGVVHTATLGERGLLRMIWEFWSWSHGSASVVCNSVYFSLSILNQCFIFMNAEMEKSRSRSVHFPPYDHFFKSSLCFALVSFKHNIFSDRISNEALKLLTQLAKLRDNFLFSSLHFSADQVRKQFLYPLFSADEKMYYKTTLLTFGSECISHQIVIADAIVDIDVVRKLVISRITPESTWRSLFSYVNKVLQHSTNEQFYVKSQYHIAVLKVLFECWKTKLKVAQQYFKANESFWKTVLDPLFHDYQGGTRGYYFIMKIVENELLDDKDQTMLSLLVQFAENQWFRYWMKVSIELLLIPSYEPDIFDEPPPRSNWIPEVWVNFVEAITRKAKHVITNPNAVVVFLRNSLREELMNKKTLEPTSRYITEMLLRFINCWERQCSVSNWSDELNDAFQLLKYLFHYFNDSQPVSNVRCLIATFIGTMLKQAWARIHILNANEDKEEILEKCLIMLDCDMRAYIGIMHSNNETLESEPVMAISNILLLLVQNLDFSGNLTADVLQLIMRNLNSVTDCLIRGHVGPKTVNQLLRLHILFATKFETVCRKIHADFLFVNEIFTITLRFNTVDNVALTADMRQGDGINNVPQMVLHFFTILAVNNPSRTTELLFHAYASNELFLRRALRLVKYSAHHQVLDMVMSVVTYYNQMVISGTVPHVNQVPLTSDEPIMEELYECVKSVIKLINEPTAIYGSLFKISQSKLCSFLCEHQMHERMYTLINETFRRLIEIAMLSLQTINRLKFLQNPIVSGIKPKSDGSVDDDIPSDEILNEHANRLHDEFKFLGNLINLLFEDLFMPMRRSAFNNIVLAVKPRLVKFAVSVELLLEAIHFLLFTATQYLYIVRSDMFRKVEFISFIRPILLPFLRDMKMIMNLLVGSRRIRECYDNLPGLNELAAKSLAEITSVVHYSLDPTAYYTLLTGTDILPGSPKLNLDERLFIKNPSEEQFARKLSETSPKQISITIMESETSCEPMVITPDDQSPVPGSSTSDPVPNIFSETQISSPIHQDAQLSPEGGNASKSSGNFAFEENLVANRDEPRSPSNKYDEVMSKMSVSLCDEDKSPSRARSSLTPGDRFVPPRYTSPLPWSMQSVPTSDDLSSSHAIMDYEPNLDRTRPVNAGEQSLSTADQGSDAGEDRTAMMHPDDAEDRNSAYSIWATNLEIKPPADARLKEKSSPRVSAASINESLILLGQTEHSYGFTFSTANEFHQSIVVAIGIIAILFLKLVDN